MSDPFRDLNRVLDVLGQSADYNQDGSGGSTVELSAVIDRDVEVVDETGAYARKAMASFRSGQVTVATGDWIDADGKQWDVEQLIKDDGYITQVMVRPRP